METRKLKVIKKESIINGYNEEIYLEAWCIMDAMNSVTNGNFDEKEVFNNFDDIMFISKSPSEKIDYNLYVDVARTYIQRIEAADAESKDVTVEEEKEYEPFNALLAEDNTRYYVIISVIEKGQLYYYLINEKNVNDIIIGKITNGTIIEISELEQLKAVVKRIYGFKSMFLDCL